MKCMSAPLEMDPHSKGLPRVPKPSIKHFFPGIWSFFSLWVSCILSFGAHRLHFLETQLIDIGNKIHKCHPPVDHYVDTALCVLLIPSRLCFRPWLSQCYPQSVVLISATLHDRSWQNWCCGFMAAMVVELRDLWILRLACSAVYLTLRHTCVTKFTSRFWIGSFYIYRV